MKLIFIVKDKTIIVNLRKFRVNQNEVETKHIMLKSECSSNFDLGKVNNVEKYS